MIAYSEVSAFTTTPGQGNRAGVVLDAAELSRDEMQALAAFLEAPETVFLTRLSDGLGRVRYFTPTQEVPFCGHATVALGQVLAHSGQWRGEALTLETLAGHVPLRLELCPDRGAGTGTGAKIWMRQPHPERRELSRAQQRELAGALGLDERMVHRGLPAACASTGLWTAFLPLLDSFVLDRLEPDLPRVEALSRELDVVSVYAYAPLGVNRFAARDFAPLLGVDEDPVTGSAGGALISLLAGEGRLPVQCGRACAQIYQGHALGQPGEIEVEIELGPGGVQAVHVGGCAVVEREGHWRRKGARRGRAS